MSGSKVLFDTNLFLYFFSGNENSKELVAVSSIYFSVVTEIELLSFRSLSEDESQRITSFLKLHNRVELSDEIVSATIEIRKQYGLKIPDAIIAATSKDNAHPYGNC